MEKDAFDALRQLREDSGGVIMIETHIVLDFMDRLRVLWHGKIHVRTTTRTIERVSWQTPSDGAVNIPRIIPRKPVDMSDMGPL